MVGGRTNAGEPECRVAHDDGDDHQQRRDHDGDDEPAPAVTGPSLTRSRSAVDSRRNRRLGILARLRLHGARRLRRRGHDRGCDRVVRGDSDCSRCVARGREGDGHVGGRRVAHTGIVVHGAVDHGGDGGIDVGTDRWQRFAHAVRDRFDERERGVAAERWSTGERFEEQHANRIDVGARRRDVARESFGREIRSGAEHHPHRGLAVFFGELRDPEVGDLRVRLLVEQDVGGLDVTMDDAEPMCGRQGRENLESEHACSRLGEPARRELGGQRATGQAFHDDERHAVVFADVVDRDDVGVVDSGRGARLALEALAQVGLLGEIGAQDLDRDLAREAEVGRFADLAHAAATQQGPELVALPDRVGPGGHGVESSPRVPAVFHQPRYATSGADCPVSG